MTKLTMTDKERLLLTIIRRLAATYQLQSGLDRTYPQAYKAMFGDDLRPHFGQWDHQRRLRVGDLVVALTSGVHPATVGYILEVGHLGNGETDECLIRELGSRKTCRVSNDTFVAILGLEKSELLEGTEYRFYRLARLTMKRHEHFWHRFGGVEFEGREAIIRVNCRYNGLFRYGEALPYYVRVRFNARTTIAQIHQSLQESGYGTRPWRLGPKQGHVAEWELEKVEKGVENNEWDPAKDRERNREIRPPGPQGGEGDGVQQPG